MNLKDVVLTISENIATSITELEVQLSNEQIQFLIRFLPVIHSSGSFINLHEFVYMPGMLDILLFPESTFDVITENNATTENDAPDNNAQNSSQPRVSRKGIGGQPSLLSKFPEIVDEVADFIKQHGFTAQARRRTETGFFFLVSR